MRFVVVTGMSGAGKTGAIRALEDLGYFCVDNLPAPMISSFAENCLNAETIEKSAVVLDIRSGVWFSQIFEEIQKLKSKGVSCEVLFMDAQDDVLVRRYKETRRRHPLENKQSNIVTALHSERERLNAVREIADHVIDTSFFSAKRTRFELFAIFGEEQRNHGITVNVQSFGFKYGIPSEADVMFDVRFIPNPYYVSSLKNLTGNNKKVRDYVFRHEIAGKFVDSVHDLVINMMNGFINEGKYHLNIAFGCTGGHHRSVAVANAAAERFREDGLRVRVNHRDMDLQARRK
jgi:UPF0042 nucleotide-binding protein